MREITDHKVDGDLPQNQLIVMARDERGSGGANHCYSIEAPGHISPVVISFQNGPIKEAGINGITNEVLLAVVADRLRGFKAGPFKSLENDFALQSVEDALSHLKARTKSRLARGVEGVMVP
jgi:hypothetical protein